MVLEKYLRILLWKYFKFEKWHLSLLSQRIYAQDIIKFSNTNKQNSTVEIGAGVGDIIRNINSPNKLCLDINENVLNANTTSPGCFLLTLRLFQKTTKST